MRFVLATQKGEAVMREMMKGDHHICTVMKFNYDRYFIVGLITFEDVIEELFGDQEVLLVYEGLFIETLLQFALDICPQLVYMGFDVFRMRKLLSENKIKEARKGDLLIGSADKLIIIYSGSITVDQSTKYVIDYTHKDFHPYILGDSMVRNMYRAKLNELFFSIVEPKHSEIIDDCQIHVDTTIAYFEVTKKDIEIILSNVEDCGHQQAKETLHDEKIQTEVKIQITTESKDDEDNALK
uniref:Cyclic nucleotide-binding domain-containing protein n=1 Tax=Heterorhabditis bacteriophora TaxID=37862 RepID=A0A1I7X5D5_HETBA